MAKAAPFELDELIRAIHGTHNAVLDLLTTGITGAGCGAPPYFVVDMTLLVMQHPLAYRIKGLMEVMDLDRPEAPWYS